MTFHIPRILCEEQGGYGVGTSDTILVGANGTEPLSRLSRSIRFV